MGHPLTVTSPQEIMSEIEQMVPWYSSGSARNRPKPEGRQSFVPALYSDHSTINKNGYPFALFTGSTLFTFGSGSRSTHSARLNKHSPFAAIKMNGLDADKMGITEGDTVKVTSPAGEVTAKATIWSEITEGTLFMPISFPDRPVNELFETILDPQSKTPAKNMCFVKLERIAADE
jgi:predicted molibdopterin-dependent oxidoreductase YjgC